MPEDSSAPYRVARSEAIRNQLMGWVGSAHRAGVASPYGEALKFIERKLHEEPLTWGDPVYQLPHLKLWIYRGLHWFFAVEYGVHQSERLVIVKEYRLLPNNPLEPR